MKRLFLVVAVVAFGVMASGPHGFVGGGHATVAGDAPTFSNEIVRIFQRNCQICHHPGDIAPFSLMTYEDASPWAGRIKQVTQSRQMPPWKPAEGCGEFQDVRRLTDEEIAQVVRWVDAGAPQGELSDLPPPLEFPDTWRLGEPDVILEPDTDFMPDPFGEEVYRCFTIPASFKEDQWVSAVDIHPGSRAIVHHVLLFIDRNGESSALDDQEPGPGYTCFGGPGFSPRNNIQATEYLLGGWAPGSPPIVLPDGVALKIPAGARVVMQVHYRPNGHPIADRTLVGLYGPTSPVRKQLRVLPVANMNFLIPAGSENFRVTAAYRIPRFLNVHALAVAPHMHFLGQSMKVTADLPNGESVCLTHIPDWDFNWQAPYFFTKPVPLPRNTVIRVEAYYDNSANNPDNPNSPPADMIWGDRSVDEMCVAFVGFTVDAEQLGPRGESNLSDGLKRYLLSLEEPSALCRPR